MNRIHVFLTAIIAILTMLVTIMFLKRAPSVNIDDIDNLDAFLDWWMEHPVFQPPFDSNVVTFDKNVTGSTIFRRGPFQVQLFTVKPFTEIVDHVHPHVDSYEIYLGGQIKFRVAGETMTHDQVATASKNVASDFGKLLRVRPGDWHGGTFGKMGGLFLSVQYWNGIPPSSVHLDWGFKDANETERNK